jgi:hypothetical protein
MKHWVEVLTIVRRFLKGELSSDIVTKDLVNVLVNRKINYFAAPEVEVLVCKAIN